MKSLKEGKKLKKEYDHEINQERCEGCHVSTANTLELRQYKNLKKYSVGLNLPRFFNHRICHARAKCKPKQTKV